MILDSLSHQALYRHCHSGFGVSFDYLQSFQAETPAGRYPLDGDNVFALVQEYSSTAPDVKKFESHRIYADIQYIISGEEIIYYSPLENLTITDPYVDAKDVQLYSGADEQALHLRAGDFAVFFPQDGHKPGCILREAQPVRKIVIKIRL